MADEINNVADGDEEITLINPENNVDEGTSEVGKDGQANKPQSGAPEKYDFKFPEGFKANEGFGKFEDWAKTTNLSQEQAQAVLDLYINDVSGRDAKATEAFNKTVDGWLEESKADPEIGGAKFDETVRLANRFLNVFGDKDVRNYLDLSGLGNNKAFLKMAAKVGKALGEDKTHPGKVAAQVTKVDAAKKMFPNQN